MSSIDATFKQVPTDGQYFISIKGATALNLNYFTEDAAAGTTSYVSGAAQGYFSQSNTGALVATSANGRLGSTTIFRDMGVTLTSSGRTFRAVQLLNTDGSGGSGWTSTTSGSAGVWKPSNNGVQGAVATNSLAQSSFNVFYFETGARGLGIAQGLIRYG
jgi:hypothetical protein